MERKDPNDLFNKVMADVKTLTVYAAGVAVIVLLEVGLARFGVRMATLPRAILFLLEASTFLLILRHLGTQVHEILLVSRYYRKALRALGIDGGPRSPRKPKRPPQNIPP